MDILSDRIFPLWSVDMKKNADLTKFDKRTATRLVERKLLNQKDYLKFLENMPDVSKKSEKITVEYCRQKQGLTND